MNEYTYDYYIVEIPEDAGDIEERANLAVEIAAQRARLHPIPAEWAARVLDNGRIWLRRRRDRGVRRTHHHVIQGMQGGYLPDLNWPLRTRKQAERAAAELARQWKEEWDEDGHGHWRPVYRVEGSARQGWYTIERREASETGLGWYIEIVKCQEEECWKEIEP